VATREKRRTSTIQVSPSLNLVLTKYATEQNITKAEAADRIFNILYPKGMGRETEASLAPPTPEADDDSVPEPGSELLEEEEEEEEDISDELNKTVKDLRTVHTIRALTGLNEKNKDDEKLTAKDILEYQKIRDMGTGGRGGRDFLGTEALDATFRKYVEPLQQEVKDLKAKVSDNRIADAEKRATDAEKKLEERDAREARAAEVQAVIAPIQEQMAELAAKLGELGERLKPEKEPESDELRAINTLAGEMRNLVQKLGPAGSGVEGKAGLADTIDQLTILIDKIKTVQGKLGGGGEGEFDWRAAALTTIGEVTTEALHTFRDIQNPPLGSEEETKEGEEGKKEELSNQVVLRRVYNYAVKKIGEGQLQLNPYDAAKELNLTPNQVWWAVEELRKKGLLKAGKPPSRTKEEGDVERGRESAEFTGLPPGVEA